MVCSLGIDLQSPADTFHFLCSLCASLILRVCCAIARATWVDEWWRPLVNIAPYMCHRPKEPTSWTSVLSLFFFLFTLLLSPHLSTTLFLLPFYPPSPKSPLHLSSFSAFLSSLLHLSSFTVVFHSHSSAVEAGMRPFLFPPFVHSFSARQSDRRTGRECQALGWE